MSLQAGKETIYNTRFQKSIEGLGQPDWLIELRKKAFEYFTENGFPTIKDEEWKYTDVKEIADTNWAESSATADGLSEETEKLLAEIDIETGNRVVFIDGVLNSELSNLSELATGVKVLSFAEAYEDETFKANLSKTVEFDFNGFVALNTAFTEQGVFIHVPKNTKIEDPIHIIFLGESESANFTRILFVGKTGSEAEIIENYRRISEVKYLTNAVVEINLADNAKLLHTRVQRESHSAFHIVTANTNLGRTGVYDNTNITLGGKFSRHDVDLSFNGEGGEAWIDGLYLVEDGQHTDTHSRLDHRVKNCNSHQNYIIYSPET